MVDTLSLEDKILVYLKPGEEKNVLTIRAAIGLSVSERKGVKRRILLLTRQGFLSERNVPVKNSRTQIDVSVFKLTYQGEKRRNEIILSKSQEISGKPILELRTLFNSFTRKLSELGRLGRWIF